MPWSLINFLQAALVKKRVRSCTEAFSGGYFILFCLHCRLELFAGAAKDFDALKDSFQFRHEARWNFLLCQIALGNMEISKVLLAEMVTDQDFPFRAKAMELSGKLNL